MNTDDEAKAIEEIVGALQPPPEAGRTHLMMNLSCGNEFTEEWCPGCLNAMEVVPGNWIIYCNECARIHAGGVSEPISTEEIEEVQAELISDHLFIIPLTDQPRPTGEEAE